MYELIIVWFTGDKQTFMYSSIERAERAENNMRMAFGDQITWSGIQREKAWTENEDGTITPTMY